MIKLPAIFFSFFLLYILVYDVQAQSLEPVQIAEKFFSKDTTGLSEYFCCEMLREEPDTRTAEKKAEDKRVRDSLRIAWGIPEVIDPAVTPELIQQDEYSAVVSVNLSEGEYSEDCYLYFINNNGWKLEAMRELALPGFIYAYRKMIESMTEEEKINMQKEGRWEDIQNDLKEITLLLKDDKALIKHFEDNREKFMLFLSEAKKLIPANSQYSISRNDSIPSLDAYGKELTITYIEKDHCSNTKIPGAVSFVIGGVLDNTAGYMYLEDTANLPEISKSGIIILKPMGGGWYLFKTT
jgi:hypothetical protein